MMAESERLRGLRQTLSDEAQRIAIDAEYSGRQHLMAGQSWRSRAGRWGLLATILVAAGGAGGAGLSALLGGDTRLTVLLGFAGAIATAVRTFYKPEEEAAGHSIKGARYLVIRGEARRFRKIDLKTDADPSVLTKQLHELAGRLDALRETEPREIPAGYYEKVKDAINRGDYTYENDPLWEHDPQGEQ